jgi:hypothetical protein
MHAVESGLFVHLLSIRKLRYEMIGRSRQRLNYRPIKLDETQVVINNVLELRELWKGVLLLLLIEYLISIFIFILEVISLFIFFEYKPSLNN